VSTHEIVVRVTPRAHLDEIVGARDGIVLVRVRAPPVDDRANAAACRVIAKRLGIGPSNVRVVRGGRSREKILRVDGVSAAGLMRAFR
jgi:uncharacterized protein